MLAVRLFLLGLPKGKGVRVRKLSLNASVLAYPMKPVCSLGQMRKNESNEQNGDTQQSWLCYLPY